MQDKMHDLMRRMVELGASDMHLRAKSKPGFRIAGRLRRDDDGGLEALSPSDVRELAFSIMTPRQQEDYEHEHDLDFSYWLDGVGRFRVNVLMQRNTPALVVRRIPVEIPTMEELGLPAVCRELAMRPRGLVLVTGPTGAGKSTTLAAMIDHVNAHVEGHIVTMEDPVEFLHTDKRCFVTQRQIGHDCASFAQALRRALRQDPDVLLVGEMRDLETTSMAITAAETGHLVFATMHTTGATATVDRIVDSFPAEAQAQVRVGLAATLQGVISQSLLPHRKGGLIAAREIMIATDAMRACIREGRTSQLFSMVQTGRTHGMCTLEQSLADLALAGHVDIGVARSKSNRPEEFDNLVARGGLMPPGDRVAAPTRRRA